MDGRACIPVACASSRFGFLRRPLGSSDQQASLSASFHPGRFLALVFVFLGFHGLLSGVAYTKPVQRFYADKKVGAEGKNRGLVHDGAPSHAPILTYTWGNLLKAIGIHTKAQWENTSGSDHSMIGKDKAIHTVAETAPTWLVASADRHHMTGNLNLLSDFRTAEDGHYIQTSNGMRMPVRGHGSVMTYKFILPDVCFVPGLNHNIVSVSKLIDRKCSIAFKSDACYIWDADDKLIGKAPAGKNGMFELEFLQVPASQLDQL